MCEIPDSMLIVISFSIIEFSNVSNNNKIVLKTFPSLPSND